MNLIINNTEGFRLTNTSGKTFQEAASSVLNPKPRNKNAKIPDVAKPHNYIQNLHDIW